MVLGIDIEIVLCVLLIEDAQTDRGRIELACVAAFLKDGRRRGRIAEDDDGERLSTARPN